MLGAIFLHLLAKLLEIRDITLPAYARGLVGVKERCFVPINRSAKTASLDHDLSSFLLHALLAVRGDSSRRGWDIGPHIQLTFSFNIL